MHPVNRLSRQASRIISVFPDCQTASSHSLMFISNVDGDGLLSIFKARVHRLWVQSLPFCLVYYVALPTLQAFHLLDSLSSCLSDCKVLAMPVHRPHAPYVGVPKWERR